MGVLNVTPDSFSDGGMHRDADDALHAGLRMAAHGADIIDVGGESTRPGAEAVSDDEQKRRVLPVIEALAERLRDTHPHCLVSIDTASADVAAAALDAGAMIVNDVTAGRDDRMLHLAAQRRVPIVLMHMQGEPRTMQTNPTYANVVRDVRDYLLQRADAAKDAGVAAEQIVIDPGIGFGKTLEHNLELLANLDTFVDTGYAVLLGASRKSFIARLEKSLGHDVSQADQRLGGTVATTALAVSAAVSILRVHDVQANRQARDVAFAIAQHGR